MHKKATVKKYAEARMMQPQLVYYYIRRGYIREIECECCGSKVIDVSEADEYIQSKEKKR